MPETPTKDTQPVLPLPNDGKEFTDLTAQTGDKGAEGDTVSPNGITVSDEAKLAIFRVQVTFWIFLGRFVEMVIVIPVTVLAIKWQPLTRILEQAFWPLDIFIILSFFIMKGLQRIPALTRFPGCFIIRLAYLLILIALHFFLAVPIPWWLSRANDYLPLGLPDWVHLSPYWSIVAAGVAGAGYFYLLIAIILQMNLYLSGMVMPVLALIISQLVYYFAYYNGTYSTFMLNVGGGLFIAVLFIVENIQVSKTFVNSKKLEEVAKAAGIISIPKSASIASLMYRQPCDQEKEASKRDGDVANV